MFNFLCHVTNLVSGTSRRRLVICLGLLLLPLGAVWAKDIPISGIFLYGPKETMAYVQVTGFLINGKTELRACTGNAPIDKSAYKNLPKLALTTVKSLERLPDGSMVAEVGDAPASCVVPSNFKFDKEGPLTPAELAEKSTYAGTVSGSSSAAQTALPPFAPGSKMVFASATDKELAEYLLADRIQTIASLQAYLGSYSTSVHAPQARTSLSALLLKDGNAGLTQYKATRTTAHPDYTLLKQAHDRADQAIAVKPDGQANELRDAVRAELKLLSDTATAKLQAFQAATKAGQPGFSLLISAKDLADHVVAVDPKYSPGMTIAAAVDTETHSLDSIVQTANSQIGTKQFDDAYSTIGKYRSFAGEEPRLKLVVDTVYKYHFDKGNGEIEAADWQNAIADFKATLEITPADEVKAALAKAEAGLLAANNKAAADRAVAISKQRTDDTDPIGAYEILADLTPDQRLLVKDRMLELQESYVAAATAKAKELQDAYTPIKGRADEDGIRQAYAYLERASKLSDNPDIPLKLDLMADTISAYYVDLALKYLNKPLSSGVGLGFSFLNEASVYRPNIAAVRDAITSNNAAYQMRARLSIGVLFRDQTSLRREFADQLQQAFATGLETSGLPVRIILPGATASLAPNFRFVGEILQHRPIHTVKKETLQSHYRSGTREIPNEAWNKADQEYEGAVLDLQKAQGALTAAQAKANKKMIEAADAEVSAVQDKVQQARGRMNSIPRTVSEDVISPYNYTRTTLEVTNIVELSFRTIDSTDATVGEAINVKRGETPKKYVILDNIKPDDTEGLKEIDAMPDEAQLMTDVEIEARDAIVKAAHDRALELPDRILAQAREKAASNDLDGAGEAYVLYLNCTAAATTPQRTEATQFLSKNFNLRNTLNLRSAVQ